MTVFIDPSEGVLKLLTRRTSLVRKMAAARSMDNAEFRILYNNRVRLLRSKWDDSADPETIDGRCCITSPEPVTKLDLTPKLQ